MHAVADTRKRCAVSECPHKKSAVEAKARTDKGSIGNGTIMPNRIMLCPKCRFQHAPEQTQCPRCGLIFVRYRPDPPHRKTPPAARLRAGTLRLCWRAFRWTTLVTAIAAILLVALPSSPPPVAIDPFVTQMAEERIRDYQVAGAAGRRARLELDESELTGWLAENLAPTPLTKDGPQPDTARVTEALTEAAFRDQDVDAASLKEAQSSIRDLRIALRDESLLLFAIFNNHGVDLSLEIEGTVEAKDGYLSITPTGGKLGSLPLTESLLKTAVDRIFESPENKEKFKLPDYVHTIGVRRGKLVME